MFNRPATIGDGGRMRAEGAQPASRIERGEPAKKHPTNTKVATRLLRDYFATMLHVKKGAERHPIGGAKRPNGLPRGEGETCLIKKGGGVLLFAQQIPASVAQPIVEVRGIFPQASAQRFFYIPLHFGGHVPLFARVAAIANPLRVAYSLCLLKSNSHRERRIVTWRLLFTVLIDCVNKSRFAISSSVYGLIFRLRDCVRIAYLLMLLSAWCKYPYQKPEFSTSSKVFGHLVATGAILPLIRATGNAVI